MHKSDMVRNRKAARPAKLQPIWPTLSLDALLRDIGQKLRRNYKLLLALNLSHALRIYHAGMQSEWTSRDIFFLFDLPNYKVLEAYNPYLAYSLLQQRGSENIELADSRKFSLLVAFGKLLLESALGRPVEDSEIHFRPDVALLAIVEEENYELSEIIWPKYVDTITLCLEAN